MIEIDLHTKHFFSDGLYAKQMSLPTAHFAESHIHKYSHLSILAKGRVIVDVEGIETEYVAPACIEIKANMKHKITAYEDVVWYCIHATNETNLDAIDNVLIKEI